MSFTLERDDETAVAAVGDEGTPEHQALIEWATAHGFDPAVLRRSESARLRALIRAGLEALRDQVLEQGYAALAASYTDEEDAETREALRQYVETVESKA